MIIEDSINYKYTAISIVVNFKVQRLYSATKLQVTSSGTNKALICVMTTWMSLPAPLSFPKLVCVGAPKRDGKASIYALAAAVPACAFMMSIYMDR
jgi:hypothetical protein